MKRDYFVPLEQTLTQGGVWAVLGPMGLAVYVALRSLHMQYVHGQTGPGSRAAKRRAGFFATYEQVAKVVRVSEKTVYREVRRLEKAGLVKIVEHGRWRRSASRYLLPEVTPEVLEQARKVDSQSTFTTDDAGKVDSQSGERVTDSPYRDSRRKRVERRAFPSDIPFGEDQDNEPDPSTLGPEF